jgi:guanylate kinase
MNKLIIFSAPSGAGKTTLVRHLLHTNSRLAFSVSACTRTQRAHEIHGIDYYFLSIEAFKQKIDDNQFAEWQEVYENNYYGTLKSEIDKIFASGKSVIFDIDVKGAMTLKNLYKTQALTVFVQPPSFETLVKRLHSRQTETTQKIAMRIAKAKHELSYDKYFDTILINDDLDTAKQQAETIVNDFLDQ